MAALSLKGSEDIPAFLNAFNGSNRYVTDFLMEEVLRHQPDERVDFLKKTAILDRFNADLCGAVLGMDLAKRKEECQTVLDDLEHTNLFIIPLDDATSSSGGDNVSSVHTLFRYHHLFADLLGSRLEPSEKNSLHLRAAH